MGRIDQLQRDNNDTPPADVWRRFITRGHTGVTTIRVDDDDTLLLLFPNSTTDLDLDFGAHKYTKYFSFKIQVGL